MTRDVERTLREGLLFSVGYAMAAAAVGIVTHGKLALVGIAKLFLMFDGGFIFGPVFVWLWGWPIWWAGILLLFAWLTSLMWFMGKMTKRPL